MKHARTVPARTNVIQKLRSANRGECQTALGSYTNVLYEETTRRGGIRTARARCAAQCSESDCAMVVTIWDASACWEGAGAPRRGVFLVGAFWAQRLAKGAGNTKGGGGGALLVCQAFNLTKD